jgi:hypothetical protein
MTHIESSPVRRFSAHAAHEARAQTHDVFGVSFEDAAFDFVERWHPAPDEDGEIQVMLEDCQTGERQCFKIDTVGGQAGFCEP